MKLSKILQLLSIVTILSLIYIHMQMQIIQLAYEGKVKEKRIIDLKEDNGMMAYNISRLKSANHLGGRLLSEHSGLKFRDNGSIVQLVTAGWQSEVEDDVAKENAQKKITPLMKFFSMLSQAEARTTEKVSLWKPWQRK